MNRRALLRVSALAPIVLLPIACAPGSQGATDLATAKDVVSALSAAVLAAANAYTGPNEATVKDAAAKLKEAADNFAALGDTTTARSAALSVLTLVNQILPLVSTVLPPAVQTYAPIAIAVIQAFVVALPPPANAPAAASALRRSAAQMGRR